MNRCTHGLIFIIYDLGSRSDFSEQICNTLNYHIQSFLRYTNTYEEGYKYIVLSRNIYVYTYIYIYAKNYPRNIVSKLTVTFSYKEKERFILNGQSSLVRPGIDLIPSAMYNSSSI